MGQLNDAMTRLEAMQEAPWYGDYTAEEFEKAEPHKAALMAALFIELAQRAESIMADGIDPRSFT